MSIQSHSLSLQSEWSARAGIQSANKTSSHLQNDAGIRDGSRAKSKASLISSGAETTTPQNDDSNQTSSCIKATQVSSLQERGEQGVVKLH
eukprot:3021697-Amphidinium_carterae.3